MLRGKKVKLRTMELGDIKELDRLQKTGDVLYNLTTWLPISDSLASQEKHMGEKIQKKKCLEPEFVITTLDDTVIGCTGISRADYNNSNAMVHIFVGADHTGKGYGTDAMEQLVDFIFSEMNLDRVYLTVFAYNERAIKSYRKVGFLEEGRLREHLFRDGKYHDVVQMAILKDEHKAFTKGGI